jgi:hypothetical protein
MVTPYMSWATDTVPSSLDHILIGCNDLNTAITFVEQHTGVRPAMGGVHPGRGTWNALLSFGEGRYMELIAPDPKQSVPPSEENRLDVLRALSTPGLVQWAAHVSDIEALAKKLRDANIAFEGPSPGSRARSDGKLLSWKTLRLKDDYQGLLPFFIEWGADSEHPSRNAPSGCRLSRFALATPRPSVLAKVVQQLAIDPPIERRDKPQLRASITSMKGDWEVTS